MTRSSPLDFRPGGHKTQLISSVHVGTPYVDKPVELRGDLVELPKIRDKPPFFVAQPSGRQFADYDEAHLPLGGRKVYRVKHS